MQLYSYPGDYARAAPTVERFAEILMKFEEDVLGVEYGTRAARAGPSCGSASQSMSASTSAPPGSLASQSRP